MGGGKGRKGVCEDESLWGHWAPKQLAILLSGLASLVVPIAYSKSD